MYLVEQPLDRSLTLRTRVRPGSIADWWLRFFNRRELLEVKLLIFALCLVAAGWLV